MNKVIPDLRITFFNDEKALYKIMFLIYGVICAYWFAVNQKSFACGLQLECSYPLSIFLISFIQTLLVCVVVMLIWQVLLNQISNRCVDGRDISIIFLPVVFLIFGVSPALIMLMIVVLSFVLLCFRGIKLSSEVVIDALYLLCLISIFLFFFKILSPLLAVKPLENHRNFLFDLLVLAPHVKGFIGAQNLSLTYLDYAQWGGAMNVPTSYISPLMQIITLIFDQPSADIKSLYKIFIIIAFILFMIGSFGFYLLLYYGLRINRGLSFFGAIVFLFGNTDFLSF